jgi:hypothetical protein
MLACAFPLDSPFVFIRHNQNKPNDSHPTLD